MKRFNRRQAYIAISIVSVLFISTLAYLSLPYINYWRSQYSYKLEKLGDKATAEEALVLYRKAEFVMPSDTLYLKIGVIYDEANKGYLAEKYYKKIKSEDGSLKLANHYLKTANREEARAVLSNLPSSDDYLYYKALILVLGQPAEALKATLSSDDRRMVGLRKLLKSVEDNTSVSYRDTAIALYLYNHGYENLAVSLLDPYLESDVEAAQLLLGNIYFKKGLYKKAAIAYENAIGNDPYDLVIYSRLIETHKLLKSEAKVTKYQNQLDNLTISIQN